MELKYFVYDSLEQARIDKYLAEELEDISRSLIQQLIKDKLVKVNEAFVKANYLLKAGDKIEVTFLDPVVSEIGPENIPLDVYYEDQDVIVVNKPTGMVVHPAVGNHSGTLVI